MEKLKLILPTMAYADQIMDYKAECRAEIGRAHV